MIGPTAGRAVEWAQWFLKQGDAHPLKAIGGRRHHHNLRKRNAGQRSMGGPMGVMPPLIKATALAALV
jgi:hypothetical protein